MPLLTALYLFIIYAESVSVKSYEYHKKTSTRNRRKAELRSNGMDPSNYRGISVCSCLGKLFTLVYNERLLKFLEEKNILSYNQIGFRRKYRTADHIFVLNTILNSYFSKGKKVYACFVDFSKAYDSVWRTGLLYKLILNGLNPTFIHLIQSMYTDIKLAVKLSDGITPFSGL